MPVVLFYMIVITFAVVFLLTVAHDEVTTLAHSIMDLFHKV